MHPDKKRRQKFIEHIGDIPRTVFGHKIQNKTDDKRDNAKIHYKREKRPYYQNKGSDNDKRREKAQYSHLIKYIGKNEKINYNE